MVVGHEPFQASHPVSDRLVQREEWLLATGLSAVCRPRLGSTPGSGFRRSCSSRIARNEWSLIRLFDQPGGRHSGLPQKERPKLRGVSGAVAAAKLS